MPLLCVYLSADYAYEKNRGVHSLSTMLPAMGGFQHFAANSPSVILAAALQQQMAAQEPQQQHDQQQQDQKEEPPACGFYDSFALSGESIAHRIGERAAIARFSVAWRLLQLCNPTLSRQQKLTTTMFHLLRTALCDICLPSVPLLCSPSPTPPRTPPHTLYTQTHSQALTVALTTMQQLRQG